MAWSETGERPKWVISLISRWFHAKTQPNMVLVHGLWQSTFRVQGSLCTSTLVLSLPLKTPRERTSKQAHPRMGACFLASKSLAQTQDRGLGHPLGARLQLSPCILHRLAETPSPRQHGLPEPFDQLP